MRIVRDVMSALPVSVSKIASFREIVAKLRECRVSAFPVLDADGKVIGVVSEADLLVKEAVADESNVLWGVVAVRDRLVYPVAPAPSSPGPYF